jgi:hypothetical protein
MDLTSQPRNICFMAMSLEKVSKINIKHKYSIKYEKHALKEYFVIYVW